MASTVEEPRATEQRADARNEDRPAGRLPVEIGYLLAAVAVVGICVGAVVAVIADTPNVTTGGTIAAISAGLLAAMGMLGMVVVFRRNRIAPAEEAEPKYGSADSPNGKSPTSRPASAKRPTPRTAASN
jgi:hypothetical protein